MKKAIIFIILFTSVFSNSYSKVENDTTKKVVVDTSNKVKIDTQKNAQKNELDSSKQNSIKDSRKDTGTITKNSKITCPCGENRNLEGGWLLVSLPFVLFLVIFFLLYKYGKLGEFNIKDALEENEYAKNTILNPQYNLDKIANGFKAAYTLSTDTTKPADASIVVTTLSQLVPPTLEVTIVPNATTGESTDPKVYRPSTSRFIALISGISTIIIALCMVSFFIYNYIRTGCQPDFSNLSSVLLALGLGLAPYGVNKISTAISNNKPV